MRAFLGLGIAAAIALIVVVVAGFLLQMSCSPTGSIFRGSSPVPIEFNAPADTAPAFHRASYQFVQAAPAPARLPFAQGFICGVRVTDLALVGFALFLILSSIIQALWLRRAVEAAEHSTNLVGSALIATQRAYVSLREFRVNTTRLSAIEDIQSCSVQPIWENGGTTPVRNGRSHVSWKYFERAIPADVELADFDEKGNRIVIQDDYQPLTIGPRGMAQAPVIMIEGQTIRSVRENLGRLLIWGWAEYDDIFEGSPRHRFEFCYQMVVTGSLSHSHIAFSMYKRFNGADDECERKPGGEEPATLMRI